MELICKVSITAWNQYTVILLYYRYRNLRNCTYSIWLFQKNYFIKTNNIYSNISIMLYIIYSNAAQATI